MKRRRFTVTQIVGMLGEAEALLSTGKTVAEVCRHLTIAESSYYQWRAQYMGVEVGEAKRLKGPDGEAPTETQPRAAAQLPGVPDPGGVPHIPPVHCWLHVNRTPLAT